MSACVPSHDHTVMAHELTVGHSRGAHIVLPCPQFDKHMFACMAATKDARINHRGRGAFNSCVCWRCELLFRRAYASLLPAYEG
jgi:hypothetical protein